MQLLVLLLLASVLYADQLPGSLPKETTRLLALLAFLPPILCVVVEFFVVRRTLYLATSGFVSSVRRASLRLRVMQWIVVGCTVLSLLGLGWLELVRTVTGDLVVLDELLAILPALLLLAMLWAVQWPLERLLRESMLLRRLDQGLPVHAIPSTGRYVVEQVRMHLLLIVAPALTVLALVETADLCTRLVLPEADAAVVAPWAAGGSGLLGLLIAPLVIGRAIGATPLPPGTMRGAMEQVLRDAGVRVRDILVWPTSGCLLNGAVVGLLPRVRYVLLTDGLLELLSLDQIRAVMAHEAGHLRHRHLPWTALILVTLFAGYGQLMEWIINPIFQAMLPGSGDPASLQSTFEIFGVVVVGGMCFFSFGAISRRFELQADAAAACDLTFRNREEDHSAAAGIVSSGAVDLMSSALGMVALVNGLDPSRHTWRHGSIRWRQQRLRSIVGRPISGLRIDAQIRCLKGLTVLVLCSLFLVWTLQYLGQGS
ncbi:MAG: M48 family metalloprotease [Planctomycetota bacterium]|nr:M48 family metalloprotease [Planctomycetota bacterium]